MIVSTTLAGPGAENTIGDALRSCAGLVDSSIVLLSGCDDDATMAAAREAVREGSIAFFPHVWPGSYGEARNAALSAAELMGATWALTVDCDERLEIPPFDFDATDFTGCDALTVIERDLQYQKPRFIRLNAGARWVGPCSERLDIKGSLGIIPGQFWELPKTAAQELRRAERGIANMPAMIELEPNCAQWRRHYAECLILVGRVDEAMDAHREITRAAGMSIAMHAWSHYRLAEQEICLERYDAAQERCATWLARAPGFIQEFGWLLAHLHCKAKRYAEAVTWAEYALNAPIDETRGGHRSPTWRAGCQALLASARPAPPKPAPEAT